MAAVRAVTARDAVVSPRITAELIDAAMPHLSRTGRPASLEALSALSPRELEVFHHVGEGFTNAEIAAALHLSESTVKARFGRILLELDLANRVQALILAYELGVVSVDR
ncbi:hypothetical protein A9Z40_00505 [Microbacterium arborescens]|uniref:HTH luxR-type domain-containing protein n=1 Tax=Microbacterium arborescens TaxID=33883 RepID=A0ABX2WN92_9MICO|nr:LuxR C-terminal-related transcriptional regulator [Microbacterium arborescens]OAZ45630.1 hypothetical protein A9Z40_00505 [Microbacterium arborescens]